MCKYFEFFTCLYLLHFVCSVAQLSVLFVVGKHSVKLSLFLLAIQKIF